MDAGMSLFDANQYEAAIRKFEEADRRVQAGRAEGHPIFAYTATVWLNLAKNKYTDRKNDAELQAYLQRMAKADAKAKAAALARTPYATAVGYPYPPARASIYDVTTKVPAVVDAAPKKKAAPWWLAWFACCGRPSVAA